MNKENCALKLVDEIIPVFSLIPIETECMYNKKNY